MAGRERLRAAALLCNQAKPRLLRDCSAKAPTLQTHLRTWRVRRRSPTAAKRPSEVLKRPTEENRSDYKPTNVTVWIAPYANKEKKACEYTPDHSIFNIFIYIKITANLRSVRALLTWRYWHDCDIFFLFAYAKCHLRVCMYICVQLWFLYTSHLWGSAEHGHFRSIRRLWMLNATYLL